MPVTPESLVRHELVGLAVSVTAADNADLVGIDGKVVAETTQTLGVERDDSDRVVHVPKDGTTFTFTLPSGEDVAVEGRRLNGRPARRTENTGDSKWR